MGKAHGRSRVPHAGTGWRGAIAAGTGSKTRFRPDAITLVCALAIETCRRRRRRL